MNFMWNIENEKHARCDEETLYWSAQGAATIRGDSSTPAGQGLEEATQALKSLRINKISRTDR